MACSRQWVIGAAGVFLAGLVMVGCVPSNDVPQPSPKPDATGTVPSPSGPEAEVAKPSVADAKTEILALAAKQYPDIPWESASISGMGLDSAGRWWIQAWTSAGQQYESEQWFVIYDGTTWTVHDSGTGMERSDYPADIQWEDVAE